MGYEVLSNQEMKINHLSHGKVIWPLTAEINDAIFVYFLSPRREHLRFGIKRQLLSNTM